MYLWVILFIFLLWASLIIFFARDFLRLWREPVLRTPVLIFESDDWGAGSLEQVKALASLRSLLLGFRDEAGGAPVLTLGMILAIADTKRIKQAQFAKYFSINLQSPIYKPLIEEIQKGVQHGVFALHMHGMEHYWPKALLTVATHDDNVNNWLLSEGVAETEALPSHLQARWTDAGKLPSSTIPEPEIEMAIDQEASLFNACFNLQPRVAVATTFVWTEAVEAAWAKAGIDVVITPGARYTCRGSKGEPAGIDKQMLNGELSCFRQVYLVRNVYFEPSLGHAPQQLVVDAKEQTFFGRPILVEMHRFNFVGDDNKNKSSLLALKTALELMQESFSNLRFMTSLELADAMRNQTSRLIECSLTSRLRIWLRRIKQLHGFSKLSRISGFALPLWLLALLVKA